MKDIVRSLSNLGKDINIGWISFVTCFKLKTSSGMSEIVFLPHHVPFLRTVKEFFNVITVLSYPVHQKISICVKTYLVQSHKYNSHTINIVKSHSDTDNILKSHSNTRSTTKFIHIWQTLNFIHRCLEEEQPNPF